MYQVYCNQNLIYDGIEEGLNIFNAQLELEIGKIGMFRFTIYPSHPAYNDIVPMKALVTVQRNYADIYSGRILNIKYGFHNEKQVTCEGELAFLLDSFIAPHTYSGSFNEYLNRILDEYNAQVELEKQFQVGSVTVGEFYPFNVTEEEYRSAYDTLQIRMVERSDGYLSARYEGGVRYLDLLSFTNITPSTQPIEFGKNMLDIARETNSEDVFSCIIPLGAKIEGTEQRIDIKSVNRGLPYLINEDALAKYGWIYRIVVFDSITVPALLMTEARSYMETNYDGVSTIEITAVDLSGMEDVDAFRVGQWVNVHDQEHLGDWSQAFLIQKLVIDLLNPANTKISIGKVRKGLTESVTESVTTADTKQPFLLESGTTGIWTWKKYSDGTCEFFGKIPVTSADVTTALGGWFRGANLYESTTYAYPVEMTEAPALEMMFQTRNGLGAMLWVFSPDADTAKQYLPQCYLIRPTSGTGIHGNINIHGCGKTT